MEHHYYTTRPAGDLHAWIELEDGTVYDPTPLPDDMAWGCLCMIRGIKKDTLNKPHYEAYKGRKRTNAVKRLDKMLDDRLASLEAMGVLDMMKNHDPEELKKKKYAVTGNCFWNARAWSKHHQHIPHKIQYGKQGWDTNNGEIWWEYG